MSQKWANNHQVTKYITWPTHNNPQETCIYWITEYKEAETYSW
ncbi:hypothetical protein ACEN4P_10955 [Marinilactibacillus psychrotolerans]